MEKLREILASKGIYPANHQTVLYRFEYEDILIDFIPFENTVLGPTNSWLKPGFNVAIPVKADSSTINILPVSYFLATKFEAFQSRGNQDPYYSHDFEDIVFVLDNNVEIVHDISNNGHSIISYMKELANFILDHPSKNDILSAHMNPFTSEDRIPTIIAKLTAIKNLC